MLLYSHLNTVEVGGRKWIVYESHIPGEST